MSSASPRGASDEVVRQLDRIVLIASNRSVFRERAEHRLRADPASSSIAITDSMPYGSSDVARLYPLDRQLRARRRGAPGAAALPSPPLTSDADGGRVCVVRGVRKIAGRRVGWPASCERRFAASRLRRTPHVARGRSPWSV